MSIQINIITDNLFNYICPSFSRTRSLIEYLPAGREHLTMQTQYILYVLRSLNYNRKYTGITNNIERRLKEHNSGKTKSTKGYCPWVVVYTEAFDTEEAAHQRELYLKSGSGREFLNDKLKNT